MIFIKKGTEPKQLSEHRNSGGSWDDFSLAKGKLVVKEQLLIEQNSLCAYCTRRISFTKMKVEHWFPRHPSDKSLSDKGNKLQLNYSNLLAVCLGCYQGNSHNLLHCDTSKAEQVIDLDPQKQHHINELKYLKATGKMSSQNSQHQIEINQILRLNLPHLCRERKQILTTLRIRLYKKSRKNATVNLQKELNKWLRKTSPYNMVAVEYLKKKIHQQK